MSQAVDKELLRREADPRTAHLLHGCRSCFQEYIGRATISYVHFALAITKDSLEWDDLGAHNDNNSIVFSCERGLPIERNFLKCGAVQS
jgi:hypothetical protein